MKLKILSNPLQLFSMIIIFPVGSMHEEKDVSGISHLLEHLLFKTKNEALHSKFKSLGAHVNASTSKEYTSYYATVPIKHCKAIIEIMGKVIGKFGIDETILNEEKEIVRQEIEYSQSTRDAFDLLFSDTPFKKSILGTKKTLANISLRDLRDYYGTRYDKKGCVICASCPENKKDTVKKCIQKHFAEHMHTPVLGTPYDFLQHKKENGIEIHAKKEFGLEIGLITQKYERRFILVLDFIIYLLCGELASKWYKIMRKEKRHVYALSISPHTFSSTGMIRIICSSRNDIVDVLSDMCQLIAHAAKNGVIENDTELEQEKKAFQNQLTMYFTNTSKTVEYVARDMLYSNTKGISPDLQIKAIQTISMTEVNDVTKRIFSGPKFVVVGNNTQDSDAKLVRRVRGVLSHCQDST